MYTRVFISKFLISNKFHYKEFKEKVDITADEIMGSGNSIKISSSKEINDAIEALVALGISKNDAIKAVQKASESAKDTNAIITLALRSMA